MCAKSREVVHGSIIALCLGLIGPVPAVNAQALDGPLSKLSIHGFLTQAYATAEFSKGGPTPDEVTLGIPEDGTFDYRVLALQFRYDITPEDTMIVQFSSRSLGASPIGLIEGRHRARLGFLSEAAGG